MSVTYGIAKNEYFLNENSRVTYGIVAYDNADIDGSATIISSIPDITSDKEKIRKLVQSCNRLELSVINLSEVVEDFLGE